MWTLNDRNPGFGHDTLITYMYKIAFKSALRDVGLAAALGVVNVLVILVAVVVYLRAVAVAGGARPERAARGAGGRRAACWRWRCWRPISVMLLTALKPEAELRDHAAAAAAGATGSPATSGRARAIPAFQALAPGLAGGGARRPPLLVLLAAVPAAYHTARHRFPGRAAFLFLVLVTQMFAPTALVVGLYREFFELGLINTYAALILTNAAFNLAFAIWILRAFFASIPREIEEAAAVDGCGRVRTLLQVVLPLALPGIVTAAIFAFIAAWNEYIVALTLMTDPARSR